MYQSCKALPKYGNFSLVAYSFPQTSGFTHSWLNVSSLGVWVSGELWLHITILREPATTVNETTTPYPHDNTIQASAHIQLQTQRIRGTPQTIDAQTITLSARAPSHAQKSSLLFGYAWRSKCWHLTYDRTVISWLTVAPTAAKLKMRTDVVIPIYWPAFCFIPYHCYRRICLFQFTSFTFPLSSIPC